MFSPEEEKSFRAGILGCIPPLSKRQIEKFSRLVDSLLEWNQRINLTAITSRSEVLEKHLIDSVAILGHMREGSLIDIGSGAGFPGLPTAIVRPEMKIWLVEATRKKVEFISEMIRVLELPNCEAVWSHLPDKRIEIKADQIVSRGTFKVPDFLEAALPYLHTGGRLILMKGKLPVEEIQSAKQWMARYRLKQSSVSYKLPFSGADRSLVIFEME